MGQVARVRTLEQHASMDGWAYQLQLTQWTKDDDTVRQLEGNWKLRGMASWRDRFIAEEDWREEGGGQ